MAKSLNTYLKLKSEKLWRFSHFGWGRLQMFIKKKGGKGTTNQGGKKGFK